MRVRVVCLAAALLVASTAAAQSRMRVALPAFGAPVLMDTVGEALEVAASPGKVFRAASMVLANLRIPVDVTDSLRGMVGAAKLTRTRNLNRTALSQYLECGSSMTGLRADSHRVQMPLLLLIDPTPAGTAKLRVALVASAQDNAGSSNTPVQCGSTGRLEGELRRAIDEQIKVLP